MMKMKNKFLIFIVFVISSFFYVNNVQAINSYEATVLNPKDASCNLYNGSTGYCYYKDKNLNSYVSSVIWLDTGDTVTVHPDNIVPSNNKNLCDDNYVYTDFYFEKKNTTYHGYYCNAYLKSANDVNDMLTEELKNEFRNAGFPESYWKDLALLKTAHPSWSFKAIKTGLNWDEVIRAESAVGMSLIQGDEQGYRSTLGGSYDYFSDTFRVLEGTNWYAANSEVVAFYMDPRNFLRDETIFQFESLKFNPSLQTLDAVKSVLDNNKYLSPYANDFMTAAQQSGVSSVYLAALARQEVGTGGTAISGNGFTYNPNNRKYPTLKGKWIGGGYYNTYNIGAGTDVSPAQNSVIYARGGVDMKDTSYGRPWNSMSKAIIGGALFMEDSYVGKGQYTIYFKKFNVASTYWDKYSHQYQTNIKAARDEGTTVYRSYNSLGILNSPIEFSIPVYENMPASTSMPNKGNPNNYLKEIKIGNKQVSNFKGDIANYTVYVPYSSSTVEISATAINSAATIYNVGSKNLNVGENKFNIVVTAENKSTKTYTLNIIRSANETGEPTVDEIVDKLGVKSDGTYFSGIAINTKSSVLVDKIKSLNPNASVVIKNINGQIKGNQIFATGDTISITSAGETKKYSVVIYGDANGDGRINPQDLLAIQKHILGVTKLSGAKLKAANPSTKNEKVNPRDLLQVQKHILGVSAIAQ